MRVCRSWWRHYSRHGLRGCSLLRLLISKGVDDHPRSLRLQRLSNMLCGPRGVTHVMQTVEERLIRAQSKTVRFGLSPPTRTVLPLMYKTRLRREPEH